MRITGLVIEDRRTSCRRNRVRRVWTVRRRNGIGLKRAMARRWRRVRDCAGGLTTRAMKSKRIFYEQMKKRTLPGATTLNSGADAEWRVKVSSTTRRSSGPRSESAIRHSRFFLLVP